MGLIIRGNLNAALRFMGGRYSEKALALDANFDPKKFKQAMADTHAALKNLEEAQIPGKPDWKVDI